MSLQPPQPSIQQIYRDVVSAYTGKKRTLDHTFVLYRWLYRPLSFPLTALFIRMGFSANQVSYLNGLLLLIALALFVSNQTQALLLGTLFFALFFILDFVDGNIARYHQKSSYFGKLLDGSIDTIGFFLFAVVAIGNVQSGLNVFDGATEIGLGIATTMLALFNQNFQFRYAYLRIESVSVSESGQANNHSESANTASQPQQGLIATANWLYQNMLVSTPVLLIVAVFTDWLSAFTLFFFFVHALLGTASTAATFVKSRRVLDKPRTH